MKGVALLLIPVLWLGSGCLTDPDHEIRGIRVHVVDPSGPYKGADVTVLETGDSEKTGSDGWTWWIDAPRSGNVTVRVVYYTATGRKVTDRTVAITGDRTEVEIVIDTSQEALESSSAFRFFSRHKSAILKTRWV